jgi:hypothetical protein
MNIYTIIFLLFSTEHMAEWLGLPLRILEVSDSNLGPETDSSEILHGFPKSVLTCWDSILN